MPAPDAAGLPPQAAGYLFASTQARENNAMAMPEAEKTQAIVMDTDIVVIPIVEEMLTVDKREVVTGGVRLTKRVTEREEVIDEALLRESVTVERVPINQIVATAPPARQEGDTLIVPVLEEVLVTEKRLMLKEEVRITRTQTTVHDPQTVTVRSEEAVLEDIIPEHPSKL